VPVKYWETIANNLSKAGWSWGCVSGVDSNGRMIFVADAHRDDGKRFIVRADELLTAFLELEAVIGVAARCKSPDAASNANHRISERLERPVRRRQLSPLPICGRRSKATLRLGKGKFAAAAPAYPHRRSSTEVQ
jgi:hypothetical protein